MKHEDNDQFIFICEGKRVATARLKEEKPPRDRLDHPRLIFERVHFSVSSLSDILAECSEHPDQCVMKPFDLAVVRGSQLLGHYRNCLFLSFGFNLPDMGAGSAELVWERFEEAVDTRGTL